MTYDRYFGDVYMSDKWDKRFLELAKHISDWSKDPSTKVGCIVVGEDREIRSTGFNGFPRGIEDKIERLEDREQKYPMICHAEENAIMHAARIGISLKGTMAYVTWPPCSRCTRSLIQAGVSEVVYPKDLEIPERWQKDFDIASNAKPEDIRKIFKYSRIIGRRFKLVHVIYNRETIEVSTFRTAPMEKIHMKNGILKDNE